MSNNQTPLIPVLIQDLGMMYPTETSKIKKHNAIYLCGCGNSFKAQLYDIKNKKTKSCGCYHKQRINETSSTHGLKKHKLYSIFNDMKNRCFNKNTTGYKYYGGRGITICEEWRNDFMSFYNWAMANGWGTGLSIDRINNDGNYDPSNCRWTTKEVQASNTVMIRSTNSSGYRGVSFKNQNKKWVAQIKVNGNKKHLGYFETALEAAITYNNYVIKNNLPHTCNSITMA